MMLKQTRFISFKQNTNKQAIHQEAFRTSFFLVVLLFLVASFCMALAGCGQATKKNMLPPTADVSANNNSETKTGKKHTLDKNQSLKVMSPDWGITAELTAMGYPPVAAGDLRTYPDWVSKPELSTETIDLGERFEPNLEMLAQMEVDLVLDSGFYQHLHSVYGDTPVVSIDSSLQEGAETVTMAHYIQQTKAIAEAIKQPQVAESFIKQSQQFLTNAGNNFANSYPTQKRFTVIQFVDSNNMRMYSHNSIFAPTLEGMRLELVAFDKGNAWGFINIKTADLITLEEDTCLLIIEPFSPILQQEINESLLWQRLGYSNGSANPRCMGILPPTWIYGGISSMVNIADNLQNAQLIGLNSVSQQNIDDSINKSKNVIHNGLENRTINKSDNKAENSEVTQ